MADHIVFAGPSLTSEDRKLFADFSFRPPAEQGDFLRTAQASPASISLIDGYFGDRLSVCHKEILECMSQGIPVAGAASMGALRAAELNNFGMVGHGRIYKAYRCADIVDDSHVAVLHGPEAMKWQSLTVAMVDVSATLESLQRRGRIDRGMAQSLKQSAHDIHFTERTWRRVAGDDAGLEALLAKAHVQQKRLDAVGLLSALRKTPLKPVANPFVPPMTPAYQRIRARAIG